MPSTEPPPALLGNSIGKFAAALPPQKTSVVAQRFYLQSLARELLPDNKRLGSCLRAIAPVKDRQGQWIPGYGLEIRRSPSRQVARYSNLVTCKSLWTCFVCANRIAEGQRQEMKQALVQAEQLGLSLVMVTLTLQHDSEDNLKYLLAALIDAYRDFTRNRPYKRLKAQYGVVGSIRALEALYALARGNGWHPHNHILMFLEKPLTKEQLEAFTNTVKAMWNQSLLKHGRDASWERGATVIVANSYIAEYIAKYGHDPVEKRWGAESELTQAAVKRAARGGKTPWELLAMYGDDYLAYDPKTGKLLGDLFIEYAEAFKGTHQLQWSAGLPELLKLEEIRSDAELANAKLSEDEYGFAYLTRHDWKVILEQDKDIRGELLQVAGKGGAGAFREYLAALGLSPLVYGAPEPEIAFAAK